MFESVAGAKDGFSESVAIRIRFCSYKKYDKKLFGYNQSHIQQAWME